MFLFNDLPDETDAMRQAAESTKYKQTASIAPLLSLLFTSWATNSFFCSLNFPRTIRTRKLCACKVQITWTVNISCQQSSKSVTEKSVSGLTWSTAAATLRWIRLKAGSMEEQTFYLFAFSKYRRRRKVLNFQSTERKKHTSFMSFSPFTRCPRGAQG